MISIDPNWICPCCGQGGPLLPGTSAIGDLVFCGECETMWRTVEDAANDDKSLQHNAQAVSLRHEGKLI